MGQMDEVLLFKQFDSNTAVPGRMTFHTAFVDPPARPDAPERQSIECRAFCSSLTSSPTPVQLCLPMQWRRASIPLKMTQRLRLPCKNAWVDRHHEFLARLCENVAHDHLSQQDGAREIAQTIVKDDGNHQGFKKYSPEKKARIVSLLMKGGWEAKLRARLKQMKSANKDVGQSSREASLRSLSLVVVGGLLGFVCAWLVPLLST